MCLKRNVSCFWQINEFNAGWKIKPDFIEHVVVYLQLFIRGSLRVVILIRPVI